MKMNSHAIYGSVQHFVLAIANQKYPHLFTVKNLLADKQCIHTNKALNSCVSRLFKKGYLKRVGYGHYQATKKTFKKSSPNEHKKIILPTGVGLKTSILAIADQKYYGQTFTKDNLASDSRCSSYKPRAISDCLSRMFKSRLLDRVTKGHYTITAEAKNALFVKKEKEKEVEKGPSGQDCEGYAIAYDEKDDECQICEDADECQTATLEAEWEAKRDRFETLNKPQVGEAVILYAIQLREEIVDLKKKLQDFNATLKENVRLKEANQKLIEDANSLQLEKRKLF